MKYRRSPTTKMFRCAIFLTVILLQFISTPSAEGQPRLSDERLEIKLFAETPEIVTPIGMVIDQHNRIFVIESHTHHPPADYDGPSTDRVLLFVDADDDGKPEESSMFANGIRQAMNLALSPDGQLYVVCAREVLRLVDENRDGVCDKKEQVLKLVTRERYAHNSLLGITFDRDGWMYVARGNTGSHPYRFQGSDDSHVEGYGDGGNVIRCRADGSQLEEFATGFWNPFDLKFDRNGRLLLVDNDPDARGPNRLVHVVEGGDYGYKSLYGGSGNHVFQGWDGSLPGTLPFIAGTGEAPSGLIDCRRSSLPRNYSKSVLATIWNENSIEQFELDEKEGTLELQKKSIFLTGGKNFRPVAIDCDGRGNLFVTDWVLVNYPNHGRGRIWRISTKSKTKRLVPNAYFSPYEPDPTRTHRERYAKANDQQTLIEGLVTSAPFLRHAARRRLENSRFAELRLRLAEHDDPKVRLGVLLAAKSANVSSEMLIQKFLQDSDPNIRQAALLWAGQSRNVKLRSSLARALQVAPVTAAVFETYLAATQTLEDKFIKAFAARETRANRIPRKLDANVVVGVAKAKSYSPQVRAFAVKNFDDETTKAHLPWLLETISHDNDLLAMAAMRRLADLPSAGTDDLSQSFSSVALDSSRSVSIRCEALLWLGEMPTSNPREILPLLQNENSDIAFEAARAFRTWLDAEQADDCVEPIRALSLANDVRQLLSCAINGKLFGQNAMEDRPQSNEQWRHELKMRGNPHRGRRVFFTGRVGCAKCHSVDGRGAVLGPDLSHVAQSKSTTQIVDSILDPSAEFPPQYQAWAVITTDGRTHRGLQLDHKSGGAIVLMTESGENVYFKGDEIEDYAALPTSIMPTGLSETMTVGEFRDLIAFLCTMK